MAESWYSIVEKDVESVDEVLIDGVMRTYPELNEMCKDMIASRDHKVRPALGILSYYANGGKDSDTAVYMAASFGAVFDGLHMHDMIDADGNVKGMKKKLFHKIPPTTKVIVAGDYMYIMGFRMAYDKAPSVAPYIMKVSTMISDGIFSQTDRLGDSTVTKDECLELIKKRVASELSVMMECAAKEAGAKESVIADMGVLGEGLGIVLRIRNDLEDLFGNGKGIAQMDTLMQGIPTVPLCLAMADESIGEKVRQAFSDKDIQKKDAERIVSSMKAAGIQERCEDIIKEYGKKAREIISGLPDSDYKSSLLSFIDTM